MNQGNRPSFREVADRAATLRDRLATLGGADVEIVAVTKGFGPWALRAASECGFRMVGESYAQELTSKWRQLRDDEQRCLDVHFIGGMQTNKVRKISDIVNVWQSLDRQSLVNEIVKRAPGSQVMIQINLTGSGTQSGCDISEAEAIIADARMKGLEVIGAMGIGPQGDTKTIREAYRKLVSFADRHALTHRSIGMTDDLEIAVESGSTMVRIGTALFGERPAR
ncbi:MAG: YggS family pyridoxal phosphate-dependent enzyme [Actinomycetota bacterium]|nr:YggS family pyridoxal phosphate-dependent enzyme [Actinomycetota bacterium]